jgi:hypothetical protein
MQYNFIIQPARVEQSNHGGNKARTWVDNTIRLIMTLQCNVLVAHDQIIRKNIADCLSGDEQLGSSM